jgi:Flp pilus assembly protein TadD
MKRAPVFHRAPSVPRGVAADRVSAASTAQGAQYRVLHERGVALIQQHKSADAIPVLTEALALAPNEHGIRHNLALAYYTVGNMREALREYNEIATRFPDRCDAHTNLAGVLSSLGHQTLAFKAIDRALALDPGYTPAINNLAEILKNLGDWVGARDVYAAALSVSPDAPKLRMEHGMAMVALGQWREGWAEMEHREFVDGVRIHTDPVAAPRWDGRASIDGKTVLIMHEQGLGDSIMCVRFARDLVARGARVHLRTPPPLVGLLSEAPGVSACTSVGTALPPHDFHVPLMSLPTCLQLEPSQLDGAPYLILPGKCPPHIAALLPQDGVPTVALSWQGNPRHSNDRRRSINSALLAPLLDLPGVRFVAMQKIPTMQELLPSELQRKIVDVGGACADFVESAHAMRRVDLVVTVDTAVAHLAGAIGVPTLVCLPFTPDYRWGVSGATTPWYRNVTVLRQHEANGWEAVLDEVKCRAAALRSCTI